jgi:hypothetical protein
MGTDKPWRKSDKVPSIQGEQKLSAGHILEAAIGLPPVPFLAKDLRDMFSTLIPMPVDSSLNNREFSLSDGSFSYDKGQHSHCIAKRMRGRQQKMHGSEKNEEIGW